MTTLFVANLSFSVDEDDLADFFKAEGFSPDRVKIVYDRNSGRSRGFGFVDFSDADEAQRAISDLNNVALEGRTVSVREAEERRPADRRQGRA